jgi:hypothetical protein
LAIQVSNRWETVFKVRPEISRECVGVDGDGGDFVSREPTDIPDPVLVGAATVNIGDGQLSGKASCKEEEFQMQCVSRSIMKFAAVNKPINIYAQSSLLEGFAPGGLKDRIVVILDAATRWNPEFLTSGWIYVLH